ncbi:MAG: hypothetical protein ICCCNLDF_03655 [Planctomycetes bacterium]|nr:hypothetical protein [Planctomycetota bacterium]
MKLVQAGTGRDWNHVEYVLWKSLRDLLDAREAAG